MALTTGARIGHYELGVLLGAGGMGEVYRARDTQLGRDVALKVLPELFVSDPERLARLVREAQTLASLNHPNIGSIHGLERGNGVTALVLELVEGPTLADRITQGPIPLDEALPIAQQIAAALQAAHDQGVIHRDVKPANIKLRPDGTVKVFDFGIAKVCEPEAPERARGDLAHMPTVTTPAATRAGLIMGTAAYMSPEQARGKPVDKRADIWAFGCVLYEMLSGRLPFVGEEVSDVQAAVLLREPDLSALPVQVPFSIRRLIERCLQKNPADRLRDIGDARLEIRDALGGSIEPFGAPRAGSRTPRRERIAWIAALAFVTLIAGLSLVKRPRPAPPAPEVRVEITTPPTTFAGSAAAIAPDGRSVAFVASTEDQLRLWLRPLHSATAARPLPGAEGAHLPFWSPDSRSIAFFADSRLKRVDVEGGAVRVLATAYRATGGSWGSGGVILFTRVGDPIWRVSEDGGEPAHISGLVQQGSNFTPRFCQMAAAFCTSYAARSTSAASTSVSSTESQMVAACSTPEPAPFMRHPGICCSNGSERCLRSHSTRRGSKSPAIRSPWRETAHAPASRFPTREPSCIAARRRLRAVSSSGSTAAAGNSVGSPT